MDLDISSLVGGMGWILGCWEVKYTGFCTRFAGWLDTFEPRFSSFIARQGSPECGFTPRVSDSQVRGVRTCISQSPGDTDAAGLGTTPGELVLTKRSWVGVFGVCECLGTARPCGLLERMFASQGKMFLESSQALLVARLDERLRVGLAGQRTDLRRRTPAPCMVPVGLTCPQPCPDLSRHERAAGKNRLVAVASRAEQTSWGSPGC